MNTKELSKLDSLRSLYEDWYDLDVIFCRKSSFFLHGKESFVEEVDYDKPQHSNEKKFLAAIIHKSDVLTDDEYIECRQMAHTGISVPNDLQCINQCRRYILSKVYNVPITLDLCVDLSDQRALLRYQYLSYCKESIQGAIDIITSQHIKSHPPVVIKNLHEITLPLRWIGIKIIFQSLLDAGYSKIGDSLSINEVSSKMRKHYSEKGTEYNMCFPFDIKSSLRSVDKRKVAKFWKNVPEAFLSTYMDKMLKKIGLKLVVSNNENKKTLDIYDRELYDKHNITY